MQWNSYGELLTYCVDIIGIDVNECDENLDACQQQCVNSIGSYTCACGIGFTLDDNGRTCTGK